MYFLDFFEGSVAKTLSKCSKITKKNLNTMLASSSDLLEKSIAIPISSKNNDKETKKIAYKILQIAKKLKLN